MAEYYVDPDYAGGTRNGAASNPWQSLADTVTNVPWDVINSSLAGEAVTVYFAARPAASDVNQAVTAVIQLNRTDGGTNVVTLDGMAKYNTNSTTPSWSNYSGTSRFQVTAGLPFSTNNRTNPYTDRSYFVVRGFRFIGSIGKAVELAGCHHVTFEYNDVTQNASATDGPGLIILRPKLSPSPGGNYPHDVTVQYNNIHNTFGEGIYVAGTTDDPPGIVSEQTCYNIDILYNEITDPGSRGGQGDGIDVKDGIVNINIIGNNITWAVQALQDFQGGMSLSAGAGGVIADNFILNSPFSGISTTGAWDNAFGRDGIVIRNNVIVNSSKGGIILQEGSAGFEFTNTKVYNNTIYGNIAYPAVACSHDGHELKNNIIYATEGDEYALITDSAVGTHSNNIVYNIGHVGHAVDDSGVAYSNDDVDVYEATGLGVDPLFVSIIPPHAAVNFRLQATSPARSSGATIASFSADKDGVSRPQEAAWTRGAYEYVIQGAPQPFFALRS